MLPSSPRPSACWILRKCRPTCFSVIFFLVFQRVDSLSHASRPSIPGDSPTYGLKKIPARGHVIRHFPRSTYFATRTARDELPRELEGPLESVVRTGKRGGHQSNYKTKRTYQLPTGHRTRHPTTKSKAQTHNDLSLPGLHFSTNRAASQFFRVSRRGVFQDRRLLPFLYWPDRIPDAINVGSL